MLILFGTNLKRIRESKQLSQQDLCCKLELLGLTMFKADIYEIENNKRLVKDFEAKALCLALSITFDELYANTDHYFGH
jgi:transcriptional regulator with XRE-family HTH domain